MSFLDIGPLEILLILVIALLIFGPGRIPEIARTMGAAWNKFKTTTSEMRREMTLRLDEEVKETPKPREEQPAHASPVAAQATLASTTVESEAPTQPEEEQG